jgi:Ca2+-binding EF-hand superfamily protein
VSALAHTLPQVSERALRVPADMFNHLWAVVNFRSAHHMDSTQFVALAAVLAFGSPEEKIDLLYEFFDLDHDGFVSSHDVFQARCSI